MKGQRGYKIMMILIIIVHMMKMMQISVILMCMVVGPGINTLGPTSQCIIFLIRLSFTIVTLNLMLLPVAECSHLSINLSVK